MEKVGSQLRQSISSSGKRAPMYKAAKQNVLKIAFSACARIHQRLVCTSNFMPFDTQPLTNHFARLESPDRYHHA
jgi:hypothetical protein